MHIRAFISHQFRFLPSLTLLWLLMTLPSPARPPSGIPGKDITEEYSRQLIDRDSLSTKRPAHLWSDRDSTSSTWLDSMAQSWEAPSLAQQLAKHQEEIPFGKGAVYIPCLSEPDLEPSIEVLDSTGKLVASGRCGRQYALLPGTYRLVLGNGSYAHRLKRSFTITRGNVTPVIPDWSAIKIEVTNQRNVPIDESYEIVRIDDFTSYGRGHGRSEQMGEELRTWVLSPGTYKIFGVGESYNTLTNFITVRLLPAELSRLVIVMDENKRTIVGGGRIDLSTRTALAADWEYGFDIGGSVDFHSRNDISNDSTNMSSSLALLFNSKIIYAHDPYEWTTRLDVNQGLNIQGIDIRDIEIRTDEVRLRSLFLWRFLKWVGPYTRASFECGVFPHFTHHQAPDTFDTYFVVFSPDTPVVEEVDSASRSFKLGPVFSPVKLQLGVGTSLDLLTHSMIESDFRVGVGIEKENKWNTFTQKDTTLDTIVTPDHTVAIRDQSRTLALERTRNVDSFIFGPEVIFYSTINLAQWISDEVELSTLVPFNRPGKPDIDVTNTVRLSITRAVTLDYVYRYTINHASENTTNLSTHRVLIRYSYTSR
jgi:hypothetical protein